jgi:predicted DsbA family dithiol-disulfide isomerase
MHHGDARTLHAVPDPTAASVTFFFDPLCPWTWVTSRWLVDVADRRGFPLEWRALSLALLHAGDGG